MKSHRLDICVHAYTKRAISLAICNQIASNKFGHFVISRRVALSRLEGKSKITGKACPGSATTLVAIFFGLIVWTAT